MSEGLEGMVRAGVAAPDFTLQDDSGADTSLSDFRGRKVILYFYPKDDTSGCTTQACDLRDHANEIDARGVIVLGVSPDPVQSHRKFRAKYDLPFRLLADTDHAVAELYGVWKQKSLYGRKYWGNERTTFIIDEQGTVEAVLPNVKPAAHAGDVMERLGVEGYGEG